MNELNRNYLYELRNECQTIVRLLEDIKGFIQANDIHGRVAHMDTFKNKLIGHMKKVDDKLYADLSKTTKEKKIEMVSITVDAFSTAMNGMAERILKFFDKYPINGDATIKLSLEFKKDFQTAHEDILKRLNNEAKILFPMYEKHCC
ncbi:MAG: hypothetical protein HZB81_08210 [Deltaproteobacteria bacterium]|nr:hypothetical protein [Deltaproteobacteria bacterium]